MEKKQKVEVQGIDIQFLEANIKGLSSLLYGKPTEQAIQNIKDKKSGKTVQKEKIQNIDKEVKEGTYFMGNGDFAFPVDGFKKGMWDIADQIGRYKKDVKGVFNILGEEGNLITINCEKHKVNDRFIPRAGCIKYANELINWSAKLKINYDASIISPYEIFNLLNRAGFHRGIGAFSPKNGGCYGMYKVVK